ncbi:DUF4082 domain-containing protein [Actinoplanes sp. NEAU-A12]|uniref:DUF4082 domain-containing protein n=1 Tax=Actinoplanes sandaracinus TaxID=3045177 RepID=A0ABT6WPW1_9ACTN|nr:DUF4082 domain-containing protein [Actinoplanes sandaracinus]MDI6101734.1 DUF4082 domain-containing protein [Actinoplanes sandaracinus]
MSKWKALYVAYTARYLKPWSKRRTLAVAAGVVTVAAGGVMVVPAAAWADPCNPGNNPIVCENSKDGTPKSVWDIDGAGDPSLQGFATDISVNAGQRVDFKIKTDASAYEIDIYRLGYYDGDGARLIASVAPVAAPQPQRACITEPATQLYDCGNWDVSASWTPPADAVSGVYIARLFRDDTDGSSHITFVVRQDASTSDVFYQTSDATWQAYNLYGGSNFYAGGPNGRAYKLSYNRPFADRGSVERRDFLFGAEYPMIRFLERNGYDVSYTTNVDSDRRGQLIKNHNVFLSVGHDEYWSKKQRDNVEAARDAGTHLAFFSGNSVYWKTRYEPSKDGTNTDHRTVVTYKETWANSKLDPAAEWTGTWRDPRFSPPSDGGRPENELMGTQYMVNDGDLPVTVKSDEGKYRLWRHTDLDDIPAGQSVALAPHTVGYESDEDVDNGFRPEGLVRLSTTTGDVPQLVQDGWGNKVGPGKTSHHLTLYRAGSGALVFSAGSIQYTWGLDEVHDGQPTPTDKRMQQSVVNLFADMGVQPGTLMSELHAATASTDDTAPTVTITSPASGASFARGATVTLTGTAADVGGRVAGVEVSIDNGATWHAATGTTNWSYKFFAAGLNTQTVQVRAADDSANLGASPATAEFKLTGPNTMFGNRVPATPAVADGSPVELGVRFQPAVDGYITGIRFYKGEGNTGSHTGSLWTTTGQRLRTGTFQNESASGWQTLTFSSPVKVEEGTTYVASYYAPSGNYAADSYWFTRDWTNGPLTGSRSVTGAGNGLFKYANGGGFPNESFNAGNYYVDVEFVVSSELPPVVTSTTPVDGAGAVPTATTVSAAFSKALKATSVQFTLTKQSGGAVTGTTAYDSVEKKVTFTPAQPLDASTSYTAEVSGKDTEDRSGGTSWSFFTAVDGTVHSLFPSDAVPTTVSQTDSAKVELGVKFQATTDGELVGVRFYQGPGNSGTHQVSLWNANGSKVDSAIVPSSTENGWRTAYFAQPAAITAGTTYVASYFAPNGNYAFDSGYFASDISRGPLKAQGGNNGVFRYGDSEFPQQSYNSANYWVDPLFVSEGHGTPSPSPSASSASPSPSASASASPSPSASTSAPSTYGVFTDADTPATASWDDPDALEVGMKVIPSVNGKVHGVRFYKGPGNTGTHTGTLWSPGGIEMATVTFQNETATGWQTAYFSQPVAVSAGHQYVVSYHMTAGHYAVTGGGLANPRTVSQLTVPANGATYRYGTGGVMPGSSTTANFWVDVVFAPN